MLETIPLIPPSPEKLIPPYLSRHENSGGAMCGGSWDHFGIGENVRLFLLSALTEYPYERIKPIIYRPIKQLNSHNNFEPKKNTKRPQYKYTTQSKAMIHEGVVYGINSAKSGVLTEIMHKAISQLDICMDRWGRVLVIRFDLHQKFYTANNKYISRFIESVRKQLQRKYGLFTFGYLWVREQEKSKNQHYHFAVYVDGGKIRHSSKFLIIVRSVWQNIDGANHVPTIKNPYHFIDSQEVKQEAVYRLSYLAKGRGKGYTGKYSNDYSTSRLRRNVEKGTAIYP